MTSSLPPVIRVLNEQLRFPYHGPERVRRLDTFTLDLSDWKLSLPNNTPCIWVHSPEHLNELGKASSKIADEVRDVIRQKVWQNEVVLIFVESEADELRRNLRNSPYTQFAVIDAQQQKEICDAPSPSNAMIGILLDQLSRSQLAPYETTRPVTGSRFFGRKDYLNRVLTHPKTNFIVIGIRRIGKSSLLHEVERLMNQNDPVEDEQQRRLYVDCSVITTADEFYREIIARLNPRGLKQLERAGHSQRLQSRLFESLASQHGGPISFLLDEVDRLLEQPGQNRELFEVLRRASLQNGAARFIVAGFRHMRRTVNDRESPLYNFGEALTMRPLKRDEARIMIETPMDQLRIKLIDRDEIVHRICHETAGMPNLIQFYCKTLLDQLDESGDATRGISANDIQSVYDNPDFRDFVLTTFMANALPLEHAIAFAMANRKDVREGKPFTYQTIDSELAQRKIHAHLNVLDEACRNLTTAGTFQAIGNRQFQFSIPLFAKMLAENYPANFIFEKLRHELETEPLVEVK